MQSGDSDSGDPAESGAVIANKYEVVKSLGRGGMGGVYLAEHLTLRSKVALKILRKDLLDDDTIVERLRREAQACAVLSHPNLVSVYDFGITSNGFPYIVMEYLQGVDLQEVIDTHGPLPQERIIRLSAEICEGMSVAHQHGVIHRDLKPTNIILTDPDTDDESLKVVDFGVAKSELPGGERQHLTQTGEVLGSPAYMSPEQIRGEPIDSRSDIYSLGCVLYEMLTGKQLFRGQNLMSTLQANLDEEAAAYERLDKKLSASRPLYEVILRCLEKNPDERFQSLSEVKDAILSIAERRRSKRKLLVVSGTVLVSLIAGLSIGFIIQSSRSYATISEYRETSSLLSRARFLSQDANSQQRSQRLYKLAIKKAPSVNQKLIAASDLMHNLNQSLHQRHTTDAIAQQNLNSTRLIKSQLDGWLQDNNADESLASQALFEYASVVKSYTDRLCSQEHSKSNLSRLDRVQIGQQYPRIKQLYQDSASALELAVEITMNNESAGTSLPMYYRVLGRLYGNIGLEKEAVRYLSKAKKSSQNSDMSFQIELLKISQYLKAKDLSQARQWIERARTHVRSSRNRSLKKEFRKLNREVRSREIEDPTPLKPEQLDGPI